MSNSFSLKHEFSIDRFKRIKRPTIGSGGCGKVTLMCPKNNPSKVIAVKKVCYSPSSSKKTILDEINLHRSLNHPNIVKVFGSHVLKDKAYIFLEFVKGGDLFSLLHDKKQNYKLLTLKQKIKIFLECVLAVRHMHHNGIIHRDLKPENILLDPDLKVKLCDFGWAVRVTNDKRRRTVCGTVEYMAPEIYLAEIQTEKTDIWALGRFF
jgi:aurora kinase